MTWKNISGIITLPIKVLNEGKFEKVKKKHVLLSSGYYKNTLKWQKHFSISLTTLRRG